MLNETISSCPLTQPFPPCEHPVTDRRRPAPRDRPSRSPGVPRRPQGMSHALLLKISRTHSLVPFTHNMGLEMIKSFASHYGKRCFGLPFALKGTSMGGVQKERGIKADLKNILFWCEWRVTEMNGNDGIRDWECWETWPLSFCVSHIIL